MRKRVMSLVLVFAMIFSLMPNWAHAEETGAESTRAVYEGETATQEETFESQTEVKTESEIERESLLFESDVQETEGVPSAEETVAESLNGGKLMSRRPLMYANAPTNEVELTDDGAADSDEKYVITFDVDDADGNALRYVEFMLSYKDGNMIEYLVTDGSGLTTYRLPNGDYEVELSYTSGVVVNTANVEFTVAGAAKTVDVDAKSSYTDNSALSIYNRTTYFNHVDIRVQGTYTSGSQDDLHTQNIILQNVSIVVDNPSQYDRYDTTATFTNNNETYEWRKTNIRVYKGAVVSLTCDIYEGKGNDKKLLLAGYTTTFSGEAAFVQAIKNCDMRQGLDFIINPRDIIQAVSHDVGYTWSVVDENQERAIALLSELNKIATPPATTSVRENRTHTIDTVWGEETHLIVESNGKYYRLHFKGWKAWSDEDTERTKLGENESELTITSDTIIYGEWIVEEMPTADAYIELVKEWGASAENVDLNEPWFTIITPETNDQNHAISYDIEFEQMEKMNSGGQSYLFYKFPVTAEGEYTIIEKGADATGYTRKTEIDAVGYTMQEGYLGDGFDLRGKDGDSAKVFAKSPQISTLSLNQNAVALGKVVFKNSYEKKYGEDIYNYPNLAVNKLDADTRYVLEGARFELKSDDGTAVLEGNDVSAVYGVSDESGYLYFRNILPGEYYLSETDAPEGYLAGNALYKVTVSLKENFPTEILSDDAYSKYYEYDMSVKISTDGGTRWIDSQHFSLGTTTNRFRLEAFNEKISGELTIKKTFDQESVLNGTTFEGSIQMKVTGPNHYVQTVALNEGNNWEATLTGLELGAYKVEEMDAQAEGYDLVTTYSQPAGEVVLDGEDVPDIHDQSNPIAKEDITITNTYTKKYHNEDVLELPVLEIVKYRTGTTNALKGAKFELRDANDNVVAQGTTDETGKWTTGELAEGTYTLVETQAPAAYAKDAVVYTVNVEKVNETETVVDGEFQKTKTYDVTVGPDANFNAAGNSLTIYNTKAVGSVEITKDFGVNNAYIPEKIVVNVSGPNNYAKTIVLNAENDWTVMLENLAFGEYRIIEADSNADGYDLSVVSNPADGKVVIDSVNDAAVVEITNTYSKEVIRPAEFKVKKVNETGDILAGAVFKLYDANGNVVMEKTTASDGTAVFSGFTAAGEYTLKEDKAPENYKKTDREWKVSVNLKNNEPTLKVNENKNVLESIYEWIAGIDVSAWEDGVLSVVNEKQLADLTVKKQVEYWKDGEKITKSPDGREDAVYKITFDFSDDSLDQTVELKAGESKTIKDIPYGTTYTVTEDAEDAAYVGVVNDTANGKIAAEETEVTVTNTYTYKDHGTNDDGQVKEHTDGLNLVKVDAKQAGKVIAGAEFTLYADKECKKVVETAVSDVLGKVHFAIDEAGTYYLKETKPADGYHANDTVYTVTAEEKYVVKNAGTSTAYTEIQMVVTIEGLDGTKMDEICYEYAIENTAIINVPVSVTKVWDDGGYHKRPESVQVTLYRDGKAFDVVALSEENKWTYTWTGLTDASVWSVDEIVVPEGYLKNVQKEGTAYMIINTMVENPDTDESPKTDDTPKTNDTPKTGDDTPVMFMMLMASVSLAAMTYMVVAKKKEER